MTGARCGMPGRRLKERPTLKSIDEPLPLLAAGNIVRETRTPACQGEWSPLLHSNPLAGRDTDQRNGDDFQPGRGRGQCADGFNWSTLGWPATAAGVQPG